MQDYIQDEQERRVLVEWAQLLRARQEAAQAIEVANVRTGLAVTIFTKSARAIPVHA